MRSYNKGVSLEEQIADITYVNEGDVPHFLQELGNHFGVQLVQEEFIEYYSQVYIKTPKGYSDFVEDLYHTLRYVENPRHYKHYRSIDFQWLELFYAQNNIENLSWDQVAKHQREILRKEDIENFNWDQAKWFSWDGDEPLRASGALMYDHLEEVRVLIRNVRKYLVYREFFQFLKMIKEKGFDIHDPDTNGVFHGNSSAPRR